MFAVGCTKNDSSSHLAPAPNDVGLQSVQNSVFVGSVFEVSDFQGNEKITNSTTKFDRCNEILLDRKEKSKYGDIKKKFKKKPQIKRCPRKNLIGVCIRPSVPDLDANVHIALYLYKGRYSTNQFRDQCRAEGWIFMEPDQRL